MKRQPTKPAPIPTSSSRKKTELELAIESIRQDTTDKPMENVEDFEKFFGAPKREDVSAECYEDFLQGYFKKTNRFNTLLAQWKTMPDYDPDQKVDLPWLEERLGAKGPEAPKQKREDVSDEQVDAEFYEDCAKGFFQRMARFNELMAHWKTMPNYDVDVKTDLMWLEENVAPHMARRQRNKESMQQACPFHPLEPLKVLNPDTEFEPLYCKCPEDQCPVWCTSETVSMVLPELIENTHPEVRAKLTEIKCKCSEVPRMKLSRSEKNKHKVFLTCGRNPRQKEVCGYFQWMHAPLWTPKRPLQPDNWVKTPVGDYLAPGQKRSRPQKMGSRPHPFAGGFKPPVFGETPKPVKSFEELCDEQNAERIKHICAPYSYDTYRRYGLGIF